MARRTLTDAEAKGYFGGLFPTKSDKAVVVPTADDVGLLDRILASSGERQDVKDLLAGYRELTERQASMNTKVLDQILANYANERNSLPGIQGQAWAAYNAVSEYADHQKAVRGKTELDRADNRLNSAWFGASNQLKQTAYASALQLARQSKGTGIVVRAGGDGAARPFWGRAQGWRGT